MGNIEITPKLCWPSSQSLCATTKDGWVFLVGASFVLAAK